MLTVTESIKTNLDSLAKQLNFKTTHELDTTVKRFAPQLGYDMYDCGIDYDDGTHGILVQFNEDHNQYNNGVYILHQMKDGNLVMEVIVPNDKNKGDLILRKVDTLDGYITGMDLDDLEIYDRIEMFGYVLADTMIKPMAKQLYPDSKAKQERFTMLYMPRFLANVARMYSGDESVREEAINSEPYIMKMMIDQGTAPHTKANDKRDDTHADNDKTSNQRDENDKHNDRGAISEATDSSTDDKLKPTDTSESTE